MPVLKYRLRSRRLIVDARPAAEDWELVFDAVNQPVDDRQSFKILSRGKEYDAYGIKGTVYIKPKVPKLAQSSVEQGDGIGSVAVIHPPEEWGDISPFFEAKFFLSAESFRRLVETDTRTSTIELWVTTAMNEKGLIYGNDPDGKELEWWPERSNISSVESISVRFIETQA
jgi:hypothetical protein